MAYRFLVYVASDGRASLCEGGVFTDSRMILDSASDYCANDFAAAIRELESLNGRSQAATPPYELRDSADDIDATDSDVLSSLEDWQLAAILEGTEELGRLANASAIYRERGRRAIDKAPCGFLLLDVMGAIHDAAGDARTAQFLATENSAVWHKAEGERPYQLDAIRLQALADMETGRDIMGRGSNIPEELRRLADAIGAAVSPDDSGDIPDSLAQELGRLARSRPSLAHIRAAFDIGTAREELSGSPFASARNMATNAALAFGGQGDPEAPICRFVDSAIRLHGEAIAAKAEARNATESLHAINAELAEAREALADWRGKALAYQEQRDSHARRADRWQRVAEAAEADANRIACQRNAELLAHNELAAFVGELAPVLAALPLAVLASDATEGGKLAKLYLRAELLASETTGERAARYRKESE